MRVVREIIYEGNHEAIRRQLESSMSDGEYKGNVHMPDIIIRTKEAPKQSDGSYDPDIVYAINKLIPVGPPQRKFKNCLLNLKEAEHE